MIILSFIIGLMVGYVLFRVWTLYRMYHMLKSIADTPSPKPEAKTVKLKFTRVKDHVLAHDWDSQMYYSQGQTKQEIIDDLRKRYPAISFTCNPFNLKESGLE